MVFLRGTFLKKASFANAVTVSEQPVLPGEIFLVEIEQTEPGWTGHMRLGLTQRHPTSPLPLYSIPDLSNRGDSWICAITKYHNDVRVRPRTGSTGVHPHYGDREAGAAPHAPPGEHRPYGGREAGAAPHASTREHRPYGGREAGAAPHAPPGQHRSYGCREADAAPHAYTGKHQRNGGRKVCAAPTGFMGKDRPYDGREAGAGPAAFTGEDRSYDGRKAGARPAAFTGEDRSYDGRKAGARPAAFTGEDRSYDGREAGAGPAAFTGEDRSFGGIEDGANNETDVTRYQDNPAPKMLCTSAVDDLCNNQTWQDSSKATASKNYFTKSESFLHEALAGSDDVAVIPSLCDNTLSGTMNNVCSVSAAESYCRKCVRESRRASDSSSHGTEVSLSPDVVAGMSAYLPSDLVLELANCGISSCTSLVDSATENNCFDMSCDIFITCETNSTASENPTENEPIDSARTRSNFPLISPANQCNGATFLHDLSISFTNHNCDSDLIQDTTTAVVHVSATNQMVDIAKGLMHDTASTNDLPNISNDNPCSSRLERSLAESVSQSLGASTSASFNAVNVLPSSLAEENRIFPTPSYNYSVNSVEARNRQDVCYTPSLAAVRPREVLEEVYEEHVEEEDGDADEGGEYESCLTRLSFGDRLSTSRGLVPRSLLLPSARYQSATPLATDEGSRIGLLYLPQVGGYAEMHYIINGEDQGVFTRLLPYKKAPLHAVVDVYGTTKRVRIVQLYGVVSLKSACRATILQCLSPNTVSRLPLPPQLQKYLLEEGPSYF